MIRVYRLSFLVFWLVVSICTVPVISSCKQKDRIPSYVLPQAKMKAVIWDMMRADQFLSDFVFPHDSSLNKDSESIRYYQQVLAIHDLSKEEFNRSWNYYKEHPALMQVIMDSIGTTNVNTLPVTVNPTPDSALVPSPPVKKHIPIPDSILRQRGKKLLEAQ